MKACGRHKCCLSGLFLEFQQRRRSGLICWPTVYGSHPDNALLPANGHLCVRMIGTVYRPLFAPASKVGLPVQLDMSVHRSTEETGTHALVCALVHALTPYAVSGCWAASLTAPVQHKSPWSSIVQWERHTGLVSVFSPAMRFCYLWLLNQPINPWLTPRRRRLRHMRYLFLSIPRRSIIQVHI